MLKGRVVPFLPRAAGSVQQQGRFLALSLPSTAAPAPADSGTEQESCIGRADFPCSLPGLLSTRVMPGARNAGLAELLLPLAAPTAQGRYRHHTQTCAGSPDPDTPKRALEPGRRWGRCSEEEEEEG